jgi:hypothetical protein
VRLIIKGRDVCSCGDGGESVCIVIFGEESTAMWRTTCSGSSRNEEPANSHSGEYTTKLTHTGN